MADKEALSILDLAGVQVPDVLSQAQLASQMVLFEVTPPRGLCGYLHRLLPRERRQLIAHLLDSAHTLRHSRPHAAHRLASCSLLATRSLHCPPLAGQDLRTLSLALIGNLARLRGMGRAAHRCLTLARESLREEEEESKLGALLLYFEGLWAGDYRHFDRAISSLRLAAKRYRRIGAAPLAGVVHLSITRLLDVSGDTSGALLELEVASDLLAQLSDPSIHFAAEHMLVTLLADLGDVGRASAYFSSIEWLYDAFAEELIGVRGTWLKGRLALRGGGASLAVEPLDEVRRELAARGLSYDSALAGLDLALALARCERHQEVIDLAEEMVDIFSSQGVEREARQALFHWVEAVRQHRADEFIIRQTIEALQEIRRRPLPLPH